MLENYNEILFVLGISMFTISLILGTITEYILAKQCIYGITDELTFFKIILFHLFLSTIMIPLYFIRLSQIFYDYRNKIKSA